MTFVLPSLAYERPAVPDDTFTCLITDCHIPYIRIIYNETHLCETPEWDGGKTVPR